MVAVTHRGPRAIHPGLFGRRAGWGEAAPGARPVSLMGGAPGV